MNQNANKYAVSRTDGADYEEDFVLWIEHQVQLLRERKFDLLDMDNLLEELDSMGRNLRRELQSRLIVLIMHLLKCQAQPHRISRGWLGTIGEQRTEILLLLEQSPSLRRQLSLYMNHAFNKALKRASRESRLPLSSFPATNPFSESELLDDEYMP